MRVADARAQEHCGRRRGDRVVHRRRATACGSCGADRRGVRGGRGCRSARGGGSCQHTGWRRAPRGTDRRPAARATVVRVKAGAVGLGHVSGDRGDGSEPGRVLLGAPSPQVNVPISLDHADHLVGDQVDQAGHVDRGVTRVRCQGRRLVHPERRDRPNPRRSTDEGPAVLFDGVHDLSTNTRRARGRGRRRAGRSCRPGGTSRSRPGG